MEYTSGQWTVKSLTTDKVSASKSLSLPDLSYGDDFAVRQDSPGEAAIVNTTAAALCPTEKIRFACTRVENIYKNSEIDANYYGPVKGGVQVMVEVTDNYQAVNTGSGQEIFLPAIGRFVFRVPSASMVTSKLVEEIFKRTISACLATGLTDMTRLEELLRSALVPSGL